MSRIALPAVLAAACLSQGTRAFVRPATSKVFASPRAVSGRPPNSASSVSRHAPQRSLRLLSLSTPVAATAIPPAASPSVKPPPDMYQVGRSCDRFGKTITKYSLLTNLILLPKKKANRNNSHVYLISTVQTGHQSSKCVGSSSSFLASAMVLTSHEFL